MRKLTLIATAAVLVAAAGVASAQAERQPAMTRAAVDQRAEQTFDRLDANRDGQLDQGDRAERRKARFERVDSDHDGSISYAEFSAMHARFDGAAHERLAARGDRQAHRPGPRGEHRMAMRGLVRRAALIRTADADRNGAISRDEFHAAALARFDRLDTDKDGTVTRDEAKAARDTMRREWQAGRQAQRAG